jgi:hypothetical protein
MATLGQSAEQSVCNSAKQEFISVKSLYLPGNNTVSVKCSLFIVFLIVYVLICTCIQFVSISLTNLHQSHDLIS